MGIIDDFCAAAMESTTSSSKMPQSRIHPSNRGLPNCRTTEEFMKFIANAKPRYKELPDSRDGIYKGFAYSTNTRNPATAQDIEYMHKQLPGAFAAAVNYMQGLAPEWAPGVDVNQIERNMFVESVMVSKFTGSNGDIYVGEVYVTLPDEFGGHCIIVDVKRQGNKIIFDATLAG